MSLPAPFCYKGRRSRSRELPVGGLVCNRGERSKGVTGVPTVDTLVAQHLLKTIAAARLMGAECILSGIRPQIAQTIVHLGVDLGDVITKATLASAFAVALERLNLTVAARRG